VQRQRRAAGFELAPFRRRKPQLEADVLGEEPDGIVHVGHLADLHT
jgi:hypothetical protein